MNSWPPVVALLVLVASTWSADGTAATADDGLLLDLVIPPRAGDRFQHAEFSCWLPYSNRPVRAVIIHQHGCTNASPEQHPPVTGDWHWRALARKHGCALLVPMYQVSGACEEWNDPDSGSERALFTALADFAARSRRPELREAPWLLWGHSGGSSWSAQMIARHPNRVLAASFRGGCSKQFGEPTFRERFLPLARDLPLLFVWGKRESVPASKHFVSWAPMNTMFRELRSAGGTVCRVIDPRSEHGCDNSRLLSIPFFDAVLSGTASPGWFADLATLEFQEGTESSRTDPALTWLPSESFAGQWKEFSLHGTTRPAGPPLSVPELAAERQPDGTVRLTWRVEPALDGGIRALRLFRDGQAWKEMRVKPDAFLATSRDATPGELRESSVVDPEGNAVRYAVTFLDVAGGESPAGEAAPTAAQTDKDRILQRVRLRLGKPGQWEWDHFKDQPLDGERFETVFPAEGNSAEQTLRIWQRDVKLSWPVSVNGRKLGSLVTAETALESVWRIPSGLLLDGDNTLRIDAPNGLDDIEIGPITITPVPLDRHLDEAWIEVSVTDERTGNPMPCRITLTRPDGTLQPFRAEPAGEVAVRVGVAYTKRGTATLGVPAGDYRLHAGRGFEWSVAQANLSLEAGARKPVTLGLRREVPTEGWIAVDSHIHTLTHSGHGDSTVEERMLTIAGEGIELAVATDHNHQTDYAPVASALGVAEHFTPVTGNEVTTKRGHFNAFPILPGARVVDHLEEDWAKLLPAIRATPGVQVITLNHPRDVHSGFIPLGEFQFNPNTGSHRQAAALDIDAMEVITSAAMQSDIHLLYRDWFALLNRGHRISAIASSDTHDVSRFILGQGRTYVKARDSDPADLDSGEVWRGYRGGRLLVSLGLLAHLTVDQRFTTGDLATGLPDEFEAEATVLGPSWVRADRVALYANGRVIREERIEDSGRAGEKARVVWRIPRPNHDVHLVVIATGPGITEPFWEIPRPYQASSKTLAPRVIGSTNPVWLDADGDGRFQSAFGYARALVERHREKSDALREALAGHDESVRIQVESLLERAGRP